MYDGTFNVLEAARDAKVKKVVAASSASVYGEASYLPIDEAHPYNNRTLYGAAKIADEHMLRAFNEMYGLPYVALRYFNVYGPRMDVYGVYTEVMIRWMDRIEQGAAAADLRRRHAVDGLHLRRRRGARQHRGAAEPTRLGRGLQRRDGRRDDAQLN